MAKIAYLINQYPAVVHSFIRREIAALESLGIEIHRFSIRSLASELVDEADKRELEKTKFILDVGILGLFLNLILVAITNPICFIKAFRLLLKVGRKKDRGLLIHFAYLAEACVLSRWISSLDVTHIHAHFAFNPTTVAMFCHVLSGTTFSFTVHGPESIDRAVILSLDEKIKRASFVAAISSYTKSQLYRWCEYEHWSKIHVIRCGLAKNFFDESTVEPVPQNQNLVCVARLSEQKGHFILLEAINNLVVEGFKLKLTLVGDGPLRPQIENLISSLNLHNHVEITGWLTGAEVKQQISDSRAMVLASFAEGLPVVIMEALALGRPVVSTYVAGIPELLENKICGWLVPAGSVEDLTSAIREVLQASEAQLERMSKIGNERVRKNHSVETEAKKLAYFFAKA